MNPGLLNDPSEINSIYSWFVEDVTFGMSTLPQYLPIWSLCALSLSYSYKKIKKKQQLKGIHLLVSLQMNYCYKKF